MWLSTPNDLALINDEVHLWRARLDNQTVRLQQLHTMLSADERLRAARFRFERDRNSFITRRGLLRAILGRYLGVAPGSLQFSYGPNGKPALHQKCNTGRLSFSVSHSRGLALYAVARRRALGVDVEVIRPLPGADQMLGQLLAPRDWTQLRGQSAERKAEFIFKWWTRMEACLKASGEGLGGRSQLVDVSHAAAQSVKLFAFGGGFREAVQWSLQTVLPSPGYAGALAVEGCGWRLVCLEGPNLRSCW
jgi:4'-phosphopantetheinyl transferase